MRFIIQCTGAGMEGQAPVSSSRSQVSRGATDRGGGVPQVGLLLAQLRRVIDRFISRPWQLKSVTYTGSAFLSEFERADAFCGWAVRSLRTVDKRNDSHKVVSACFPGVNNPPVAVP